MSVTGDGWAYTVAPIGGIGEVREGDDLGGLIAAATALAAGDVVVVAQKVVSKAEGRARSLGTVTPGAEAERIAATTRRDPRLVELILSESDSVLRESKRALIVRTRHGLVCANAGIDRSNLAGADEVMLLPADPDGSARRIRASIAERSGTRPGVVIADSFGRPWRLGQAEVAIGAAGIEVLDDWRGRTDREGRALEVTEVAVADQIAGAADLARSKDSGHPVVVISGLERFVTAEDGPGAAAIERPADEDLFS